MRVCWILVGGIGGSVGACSDTFVGGWIWNHVEGLVCYGG